MALTLLEATIQGGPSKLERGVVQIFTQSSPLLDTIPMHRIDGRTLAYNQETALPGIGWRAVNSDFSESTGTINPKNETLKILGGKFVIDRYEVGTQPSGSNDLKAGQFRMKAQAAANEYDRAFLEGDDLIDPNGMVGLRRRLTGNQVILANANGATLTLMMIDDLIGRTYGDVNKMVMLMNRKLSQKLNNLVSASGGTYRIDVSRDDFGRQIQRYGGVRIGIVEQTGDQTTILDFDEDPGDTTADCASIYCVYLADDGVHGIYNSDNGKQMMIDDVGIQQAEPRYLGRTEAWLGMAVRHPRAATRLRGLTNT